MNCIAGINWSAGVPLSWTMFLNTSSAGLDAAGSLRVHGCAEPAHPKVTATAKARLEEFSCECPSALWIVPDSALESARLLHRECLFGLVGLLPHRIGDGHRDRVLPGLVFASRLIPMVAAT